MQKTIDTIIGCAIIKLSNGVIGKSYTFESKPQ